MLAPNRLQRIHKLGILLIRQIQPPALHQQNLFCQAERIRRKGEGYVLLILKFDVSRLCPKRSFLVVLPPAVPEDEQDIDEAC